MRTYITAFMLVATLGLVSCGGGNDVASSGASAVSAAAPTTTTVAPEPKVNGQVDERTGVAPMLAAMTPWSPTANGGCGKSLSFGWTGPEISQTQQDLCNYLIGSSTTKELCNGLGGDWVGGVKCTISTPPPCEASATYGGSGPLLTATTAPTLAQCAAAFPGIATGNPWTVYSNGGCANSSGWGHGSGPPLTLAQQGACSKALYQASRNEDSYKECMALGGNYERTFIILCLR